MEQDSLALFAKPALEAFLKPWDESREGPQMGQQNTLM